MLERKNKKIIQILVKNKKPNEKFELKYTENENLN